MARSKLSLFANQTQSPPPHPPAPNRNSGADSLTPVEVPHSQSSTFFLLYLMCLFNTYNSRNKLILFITATKKTKTKQSEFIFFKPEQEAPKENIL